MKPLLIVKTGTTLESLLGLGDFEDWICAGMGVGRASVAVIEVFEGESLPDPARHSAIVVTGSPAMVSDREPWSERTADWLREAHGSQIPTLGICYGHQLIAHALGGSVGPNPRGREVGTTPLTLEGAAHVDPLFAGLADELHVHMSHFEAVLRLPDGARLLGTTEQDPNAVFSIGSCWGIQFHPEFDAEIMRGYLTNRRDELEAEGIDTDRRLAAVAECPDGPSLLRRFAQRLAQD